MYASETNRTRSASRVYYELNVIMATNRRLGDCLILVAECEAVYEAILMGTQKRVTQIIIIHSVSQSVVNAMNER